MDSGTDAAWYRLCARECRRDRRERRSLLGRPLMSILRHAGPDYPQADQRLVARHLRIGVLFRAVLYPRQRSSGTETLLEKRAASRGPTSLLPSVHPA